MKNAKWFAVLLVAYSAQSLASGGLYCTGSANGKSITVKTVENRMDGQVSAVTSEIEADAGNIISKFSVDSDLISTKEYYAQDSKEMLSRTYVAVKAEGTSTQLILDYQEPGEGYLAHVVINADGKAYNGVVTCEME